MRIVIAAVIACAAVAARPAGAQSLEAAVHFSAAQWSEFDEGDRGVGGRVTWRAMPAVGVDAELTWYPSDFVSERASFSRQRVEGLFGVSIGPRLNRIRPFAKGAAGFLKISPPDAALACIAIFPPPLACVLAGGRTLPAIEIGGGLIVDATDRTFLRADIGQRLLRYPGPTLTDGFVRRNEDFYGGALRFTLGGGIRF
ncbi:MAG TPA: hypothetical protein VEC39_19880 [Vicinamibacterales bacterium]|nr:hypothetical protein [Vicinamibacterales bacterium]